MPNLMIDTVNDYMPEVRTHECTFVTIKAEGWGEQNEFRLWWPEHLNPLFNSSGPPPTTQDFQWDADDNLVWEVEKPQGAATLLLIPEGDVIALQATVRNTSEESFATAPAACFQTWNARDFYSYDLSRIWAQIEGTWQPLSQTQLDQRSYLPHGSYGRADYAPPGSGSGAKKPPRRKASEVLAAMSEAELAPYREKATQAIAEDPRYNWIQDPSHYEFVLFVKMRLELCRDQGLSQMETSGMPENATHPLFCAIADDGQRAVGTAWANWMSLFHNNDPWIGCLHSSPQRQEIAPGTETFFHGWIFFSDTGLDGLIERFNRVYPQE